MSKLTGSSDYIVLPEVLDLNSACDLKSLLQEKTEKGTSSQLDGSNVTRITTPAIQILLAYAKTVSADGLKPGILNPSPALKSAFNELGLQNQLSQWSVS